MDPQRQEGEQRRVPLYLRIDVLAGALVTLLAILVWTQAQGLPIGELRYFGPGFLPRILALVLLAGGVVLLASGISQPHSRAVALVLALRGPLAVGLGILAFAATIKGMDFGIFSVPQLGLLVAGPLAVLLAGMGSVEGNPRELLVLGIALSALLVVVFVDLLSMQVPVFPAFLVDRLPLEWGPDWPRRVTALFYLALAYVLRRLFGLAPVGAAPADRGPSQ